MRYVLVVGLLMALLFMGPMTHMPNGDKPVAAGHPDRMQTVSLATALVFDDRAGDAAGGLGPVILQDPAPPARAGTLAYNADAGQIPQPLGLSDIQTVSYNEEMDSMDLHRVKAVSLTLRSMPAANAPIVATLTQGDQARITGQRQKGWVLVQARRGGIEGWAYLRDLMRQ